jgi:hypothetical protein
MHSSGGDQNNKESPKNLAEQSLLTKRKHGLSLTIENALRKNQEEEQKIAQEFPNKQRKIIKGGNLDFGKLPFSKQDLNEAVQDAAQRII